VSGEIVLVLITLGILLLLVYAAGVSVPTKQNTASPASLPKEAVVNNLAIIPYDWGFYSEHGEVFYRYGTPQITHVDYTVRHSVNPSIRIDAPATKYNGARELNWSGNNTYHIPVQAGDTIYFGCWVKTAPSTNSKGAIIGFDMYHDNQRVWEVAYSTQSSWGYVAGYSHYNDLVWVPSGVDWTYISYTWVIPTQAFSTDDYGNSLSGNITVNYIIPWLCGYWKDPLETASVWFTDATLYIKP
jgi:hypothetical protein